MAESPKSFWGNRDLDPENTWLTAYDGTPLAQEADIIYYITRAGIPLPLADNYELWELSSALGLHRIETRAEHDAREIVLKSQAYYEETREAREAYMAEAAQRRRERKQAGRKR